MLRTRTAIFAAVLALLTISAAHAAIDNNLHRTFNVQQGGTLTVDADLGNVIVTGGGSGVTVDVKRRAHVSSQSKADDIFKDYAVEFGQSGNDVRVRARYDHPFSWLHWDNDLDVDIIVSVPATSNLSIKTSGGNLKVGDLHGEVRAKTSGGNVELARITGPVDAGTSGGNMSLDSGSGVVVLRTSGGSVHIGTASGSVDAKTSGGSIEIIRAAADIRAHTSGGGITIEEAMGTIDASTSGGSIKARLAQQPRGESTLSTSGGSITVSIAPSVALDLDAHSSGGDVVTDLPITILGKQSDDTLNGKINGGGPRLTLRTSGGDIRVRKL
jgi:hypothetical protein